MAEPRFYTGAHLYVGVDVHKHTSTVPGVCQRQMVQTAPGPAEPARLAASLSRWFPGAILSSAYEAGFARFVLHRARTPAGVAEAPLCKPVSNSLQQDASQPLRLVKHNSVGGCGIF